MNLPPIFILTIILFHEFCRHPHVPRLKIQAIPQKSQKLMNQFISFCIHYEKINLYTNRESLVSFNADTRDSMKKDFVTIE